MQRRNPQNWALLIIYSGYRALLAMLMTIMFLLTAKDPILGAHAPSLFILTTGLYSLFALSLLLYQLFSHRVGNTTQIFLSFLIDVMALVLISHSSGEKVAGLSLLILPAVAAGNMLLSMQLGALLAAMATIAVLADSFFQVVYEQGSYGSFVGSGMLGMAFFTTSLVVQYMTRRIAAAQELADIRKADVQQLLKISERIVQNMRTGILVVKRDGIIRLINDAAAEMLNIHYRNNHMPQLAPRSILETIHSDRRQGAAVPFREGGRLLQVNHARMAGEHSDDMVLFIEDVSKLAQQAQQLKLASLGQFTASIAHEIRNPLGAISHAAQLLAESDSLPETDKRLLEIVTQQSARMNNIIENILQLSRRQNPRPEYLDLRQWLEQFRNDFMNSAPEPCYIGVETTGNRLTVNVDPSQLHQILSILVDNGLRYSAAATGKRSVYLYAKDSPNQAAPYLDIIDDGPGVEAENVSRLFEPFFTTEARGTGLGLYICKELCEYNQINIGWLRCQGGKHDGKSCFRLSFAHPDKRHALD